MSTGATYPYCTCSRPIRRESDLERCRICALPIRAHAVTTPAELSDGRDAGVIFATLVNSYIASVDAGASTRAEHQLEALRSALDDYYATRPHLTYRPSREPAAGVDPSS